MKMHSIRNRESKRIFVVGCIVAGATGVATSAIDTVALSGPAMPGAQTYIAFQPHLVALGPTGAVAFSATASGGHCGADACQGIWRTGALLARLNGPAPGAPSGTQYTGFSRLGINARGQVSYLAEVRRIVDSVTLSSVWIDRTLVALQGNPAPGTEPGVVFRTVRLSTITDSGDVVFIGELSGTGISGLHNDLGLWRTRELIARRGDRAPGETAVTLSTIGVPAVTPGGSVSFRTTLQGTGITDRNNTAVWRDGRLVFRNGTSAPGTVRVFFTFYADPAVSSMQTAVGGVLLDEPDSGAGGLWVDGTLVARTGDVAPGTTLRFGGSSRFYNYRVNNRGQVAFMACVSSRFDCTGGTVARGIWLDNVLVVLPGREIPGMSARFSDISALGLSTTGWVAFSTGISDGTTSGRSGIFVGNGSVVRKVVITGDALAGSSIATLHWTEAATVANDRGQVLFVATLTDGRQGVFLYTPDDARTDADRVFNWAESTYPGYFPSGSRESGVYDRYTYRFYPATGNYLAVADGRVVIHNGRDWNLLDVGSLQSFFEHAVAAGY